jgi:hypothetical protein
MMSRNIEDSKRFLGWQEKFCSHGEVKKEYSTGQT